MNISKALPTEAQYRWQDMEMGMFVHFGLYTFNNNASVDGEPDIFNPTALDARQWVSTAKKFGFKYLVLTAKHHEGFCLWQTKTTDYSVKSSPWLEGKGDVVAQCAQACKEEGIGFGIYLSPWDRHEPCFADKEKYDEFYTNQLTELLTNYGDIVEVWFDGFGSEGREYDWERIMSTVYKNQQDAMIFNMGRPTIRWVGNEDGLAPYPCSNIAQEARVSMGTNDMLHWLPNTPEWIPAECDVPIRKDHWTWLEDDEKSLLSLETLIDIYYRSVGHGANLLLNIAPDRRGLLPEIDVQRAMELSEYIKSIYQTKLGEAKGEGVVHEINFGNIKKISHVITMEEIKYGENIKKFIIEADINGEWEKIIEGSIVGHKKIDKLSDVYAQGIRIKILESDSVPVIRSFAAYE